MSQEQECRPSLYDLEDQGQLELPLIPTITDKDISITGKAGITVQVLGTDPHSLTRFLQVHNRLETLVLGTPIIPMYGGRAKPPGFGNAGGGMEPNELERFRELEPEWFNYYSSLGMLSPTDLAIIGCAFRESIDESGFDDLEIVLDENNRLIILTDYYYREGHRVLTVWGEYQSHHSRPIKEGDEIDYVDWVDISMPMVEVFKRLRRELGEPPVYPYWSHIRRIGLSIPVMDRYRRDTMDRPYSVGRLVHHSWRTVFRVGRGDDRFPPSGFLISPYDWYHMFDIMLEKGIEDIDNDVLLSEFNGKSKTKILVYGPDGKPQYKEREKELKLAEKIAFAKEQYEKRLEEQAKVSATTVSEIASNNGEEDLAGSEDYTGIRSTAEVIRAEDEEYARWLEGELSK